MYLPVKQGKITNLFHSQVLSNSSQILLSFMFDFCYAYHRSIWMSVLCTVLAQCSGLSFGC